MDAAAELLLMAEAILVRSVTPTTAMTSPCTPAVHNQSENEVYVCAADLQQLLISCRRRCCCCSEVQRAPAGVAEC
jgi:hypothetical protein